MHRPHLGLIDFHDACKALFCPACNKCGQHHRRAALCTDAGSHDICWTPVGSAPITDEEPWNGEGEGAIRTCQHHGDFPWRECMTYTTMALFPGNRFAKSSATMAELCSWPLGVRPWDGSLTAPQGSGRIWMILCQTLSSSAMLTIQPLVERYMGSRVKKIQTSSNSLAGWQIIKGAGEGDIIKIVSQDQHQRTAATVSPLEGVAATGIAVDEPITPEIRAAYGRGLISGGADYGWGRELMGMTFLEGGPKERAYCFNEIYQRAGNRGGESREIWARSGSIHENPANTPEDIRKHLARFPHWEREAREHGIYETLKGRILAEFDPEIHVWDDAQRDVLWRPAQQEPSGWPIYMAVDPHDTRPWVMAWVAIDEAGEWYVVREWPEAKMDEVRHYRDVGADGSYEGYARIITEIEDSFPGKSRRIVRRLMDPRFGDTEKAGQGQTVKTGMRQQGFYFETDSMGEKMHPGHLRLRELLLGSWEPGKPVTEMCHPHLHVARRCKDTRWAFLNYVVKNDAKSDREQPDEAGKDRIDVLRYISMARPMYVDWRIVDASMKRQQERLGAKLKSVWGR